MKQWIPIAKLINPDIININDNDTFKKSMQNQLQKVIREKKEKFYEFRNSGKKNSDPIATSSNTKTRETQGKYPDDTAVIIVDSILNGIYPTREIENERTCC